MTLKRLPARTGIWVLSDTSPEVPRRVAFTGLGADPSGTALECQWFLYRGDPHTAELQRAREMGIALILAHLD